MDGNGRWATERGLSRSDGHRKGYEVFRELLKYLRSLSIPEVTFFALSTENLSRPADEVSCLMQLFLDAVQYDISYLIENNIRVKVVGDRSSLSRPVCKAIDALHQQSIPDAFMQMNICFAYSGQWHIEHAFKLCQSQQGGIDEFRQLMMDPFLEPIDLLIRSGNVSRISNFALWPLAYAELMFLTHYWPDVTTEMLDKCLKSFESRQRRFGQIA